MPTVSASLCQSATRTEYAERFCLSRCSNIFPRKKCQFNSRVRSFSQCTVGLSRRDCCWFWSTTINPQAYIKYPRFKVLLQSVSESWRDPQGVSQACKVVWTPSQYHHLKGWKWTGWWPPSVSVRWYGKLRIILTDARHTSGGSMSGQGILRTPHKLVVSLQWSIHLLICWPCDVWNMVATRSDWQQLHMQPFWSLILKASGVLYWLSKYGLVLPGKISPKWSIPLVSLGRTVACQTGTESTEFPGGSIDWKDGESVMWVIMWSALLCTSPWDFCTYCWSNKS